MNQRTPRWPALALLTTMTGLLALTGGCGPPRLTRDIAARLITEHALPDPVESFSYQLDNAFRYRLLEACAEAGLIVIQGEGVDLKLQLTPLGREQISRLSKKKVGDTYQYTLFFATPVRSELQEITAIGSRGPNNKQVGYTWKYDCPPLLERCTTMNNETQPGSAKFIRVKGKWKVK